MTFGSIAAHIRGRTQNAARRFRRTEGGNVAVLFAIAVVPIIGLVGAAIDYARVNNARTAMQAALDTAALMISKDAASLTTDQITQKAQAYFNSLYNHPEVTGVTVSATYTANTGSGSTVVMTGSGTMSTAFMKVVGFPTIDFGASSTTTWGSTKLRVALVLDNTGSMKDDGKISALRTAATNLVNQLSATATNPGDVMISLVPFAKDVNVGTDNVNASWIKWSGQSDTWEENNGTCSISGNKTKSSCTSAGVCSKSKYSSSSSCTSHGGTWTTGVWTPANHNKWTGCVTDRDQDYDTLSTAPSSANTATLFPAEEYVENSETYCKPGNNPPLQKITPLTYDWSTLKSNISAMQPTGGTNQAIGLAWGWLSLLQQDPLNAPSESSNYQWNRVIILLSDGLNTEDRWPSYGNGQNQYTCQPGNVPCIDARQKKLCDNIKAVKDSKGATMYTIYTIQVNTGNDPTSSVLQYCASDSSKFFLLTSANQVISTFDQIGTALSKLRLAK